MDTQECVRLTVKDDLEETVEVAADMSASHFPEKGSSCGVRDFGGGEFCFGFAHHRNLRNAVDAVRNHFGAGRLGDMKRVTGGEAALFHRRRGERGKPDDIACRVDVGNGCLVLGIDRELPLLIGGQADGGKIQRLCVADPSHRVEHHVGCHCFAVLKPDRRVSGLVHEDVQMFLAEPHHDPILLYLGIEGLRDFLIQKPQQLSPSIDEGDSDPEGGQHRGIFCADDTSADDDDAGRVLGRAEKRVGIAHDQIVERDVTGPAWA